jgi:hypothetical protein
MSNLRCNPQYVVYDMRQPRDLKQVSISGYKKSDVCKAFQNSLINSKLEDSLRWVVELHSSGMNAKIWELLYNIYLQYIHINNPHFYLYFIKRRNDYFRLVQSYPDHHEIFSRNDQSIRNIYAELVSIIVLSKKTPLFNAKSIPKLSEKLLYDKMELKKRMMGLPIHQIYSYVDTNDPSEIKLGLNEIYSNIYNQKGNFPLFAFWIMWLERISAYKKKSQNNAEISLFETHLEFKCIPTVIEGVKEEYQTHWVWKIWKFIIDFKSKVQLSKEVHEFINAAFQDFVDDFKPAQYGRKKYLIYLSFYALKNMINFESSILYPRLPQMYQAIGNINMMYGYINQELTKNLGNDDLCKLEKMYIKLFNYQCSPEKKSVIQQFVPVVIQNTQINPNDLKIKSKDELIKEKRQKTFIKNDAPLNDDVVNKIDFSVGNREDDPNMLKTISISNQRKVQRTYEPPMVDERVENEVVSKVLKREELEKIREEKKNAKMKAFMDLIPMKKEEPSQITNQGQKHIFDYLQKEEKPAEMVTINLSKKYVHSMSED